MKLIRKIRQSAAKHGVKPRQKGEIVVDGVLVKITLRAAQVSLTDSEYENLAKNAGLDLNIPVETTVCHIFQKSQTNRVIGDGALEFLADVADVATGDEVTEDTPIESAT